MKKFTLDEAAYGRITRRQLLIVVSLILIAGAIALWLDRQDKDFAIDLVSVPVLGLIFGFAYYRALKKRGNLVRSYCLTIDGNRVTREMADTRTVSLSFMEIKEIVRTMRGSLVVKGEGRANMIIIPYYIIDRFELEGQLLELVPAGIKQASVFYDKLWWPLAIISVAMAIGVNKFANKPLIAICGFGCAAMCFLIFYQLWTSKNIPYYSRRLSWIFLVWSFTMTWFTISRLIG